MVLLPKKHKGHDISLINTLVEENFTGVENMGSRIFHEIHVYYFQVNT